MAVPSSGQLRLYADIGVELGVAQSNVSLGTMSDSAGFSEPDTMSDFYGYVDAIAPSVSTGGSSSVSTSSMTISGNVTSDGGGTITERGFYFGTNSSAATSNTKYVVSGTTGSYSRSMTGLSSGTTYYWWAYATNVAGTTIGSRNQAATSVPNISSVMSISFPTITTYEDWINGNKGKSGTYASLANNSGGTVSMYQQGGGSWYTTSASNNITYQYWPSPFNASLQTFSSNSNPLVANLQNGFSLSNKGLQMNIAWDTPSYVPGSSGNAFQQHTFVKSGYTSYTKRLWTIIINIS